MAKQPVETNVDSNLWASAMKAYETDKGIVDRAQGQLRKHQLAYEKQGIPAATIRARYKERDMSDDERMKLYAEEAVSRRALALCIWDAETEEEFTRMMERAAETPPADPEELDGISGAEAYNNGFYGGAHQALTADNNPHVAGTIQHQQWSRGCKDGIDYKENFGDGTAPLRHASGMGEPTPNGAAPAKRGRPRKGAAPVAPAVESLFGDPAMPEPAEMPK